MESNHVSNNESTPFSSVKIEKFDIITRYARISVTSVGTASPALLLIHGNSFCSKIWKNILSSDLSSTNRIVAFDLPGHGDSGDAFNPAETYNQPGYAKVAVELLEQLKISEVIVFGWSLGGHIGIEMLPIFPGIKGLMIVGTPPVGYGELDKGFTFGEQGWKGSFAARDNLTEEDLAAFALGCADKPYEDWMKDCVSRTDQKARKLMFEGFASGECLDQRKYCKTTKVPIAVVNGAEEPFVNLDFVKKVEYGNLWSGECIEMPGLYHAPFWAKPQDFQKILDRFVNELSGRA